MQAGRFFFLEVTAATVSPLPDFSLWDVDKFDLFAGIIFFHPAVFAILSSIILPINFRP